MNQTSALDTIVHQVASVASQNLKQHKVLAAVLLVFGDKGGDSLALNTASDIQAELRSLLSSAKISVSRYEGHTVVFVAQSTFESEGFSLFTITASNRIDTITYIVPYDKTNINDINVHKPIRYHKVINGWIENVWQDT